MSSDCMCKARWSRDREAYPAAILMLSVLGTIDAILDIEVKELTGYTENERITNHQIRCNIEKPSTGIESIIKKLDYSSSSPLVQRYGLLNSFVSEVGYPTSKSFVNNIQALEERKQRG